METIFCALATSSDGPSLIEFKTEEDRLGWLAEQDDAFEDLYTFEVRGEISGVSIPNVGKFARRELQALVEQKHGIGPIADLPAEDIEHLVQAVQKGGMPIEQDIPPITNTPIRAQVRGIFVPFTSRDAIAFEQATGESLCLVPCVVPYALPLSLATSRIEDFHWKTAVRDGKTTVGRDEWARQYLQEHSVTKVIAHIAERQSEQAKGNVSGGSR
jgi:hypothetical protein